MQSFFRAFFVLFFCTCLIKALVLAHVHGTPTHEHFNGRVRWPDALLTHPPKHLECRNQVPLQSQQSTIEPKSIPPSQSSMKEKREERAFFRCWLISESWFSPKKSPKRCMKLLAVLVARSPSSTSSTLTLKIYSNKSGSHCTFFSFHKRKISKRTCDLEEVSAESDRNSGRSERILYASPTRWNMSPARSGSSLVVSG